MTRPEWNNFLSFDGCYYVWFTMNYLVKIIPALILMARPLWGAFEYKPPRDVSQVRIFLHTYDVGEAIYSRFGHNALRIVDRSQNLDMVFNWGTFDPSDPVTFAFNFYQNRMRYTLGIFPYPSALEGYAAAKRSAWEDELNLSSEQKTRLLLLLSENSRAENRPYQYKYFDDNCSTRIRDYLDVALDGTISRATQGHAFEKTYRDIIEEAYTTHPFISMTLDIMMNSRIDKKLDIWDSMFLPHEARKVLLSMTIENQPLLIHSKKILEFRPPGPSPLHGYLWVQVYFYSLLGLSLAMLWRKNFRADRLIFLVLGLAIFPLFAYGGIVGLLIPLNWLFSSHADLHHNANLLLFMPMDIIFAAVGITWICRGRPTTMSLGSKLKILIYVHVAATVGLAIFWALGMIEQNLRRTIWGMLPPYVISLLLVACFGRVVYLKPAASDLP